MGSAGCLVQLRRGLDEWGSELTIGGSKLVIFVHLIGGMKIHFLACGRFHQRATVLFSFHLLLVAFAVFVFLLFTVLPSTDSLSNVHPLC